MTHAQYLHQAQFALFGCQMVEESLKSFLMYAREVHKISSSEYAEVSKSDEELDETPLGGLIRLVKKVAPAHPLIDRLEKLRPDRNHCAHRALVLCFIGEVSSDISRSEEYQRLCAIGELAWSCFEEAKFLLSAAESRLGELRQSSSQG
jgi:hypothetical protein